MRISHKNMLPGMINNEIEFYLVDDLEIEAVHNKRFWKFNELPEFAYEALKRGMNNACASIEEMKHFVMGRYAGVDREADIKADGTLGNPDYLGSGTFDLGNGQYFTFSELRVLRLAELPDKLIADKLCISTTTVLFHWQNMRIKTGLSNKVELAVLATKKGII